MILHGECSSFFEIKISNLGSNQSFISHSSYITTLNLSFLFCKTKLTIPVLASQVRFLTEKEHLPNIRYV